MFEPLKFHCSYIVMHGQFYFILVYVATAAFQRSGSQTLNFVHCLAFALKFCDKGLLSVGGVFGRGLHEPLLTCSSSILFLTTFVFNALRE